MKVVLIHNYYQQPGGEDSVFESEVQLLKARGHEVHCYIEHNDRVSGVSRLRLAAGTVWSGASYHALGKLFRQAQPQIAHFHNTLPLISPAGYCAAKAQGIAVVQTLHNYRLICPAATLFRAGRPCEDCLGRAVALPAMTHRCYRGSRTGSATIAAMLAVHRQLGTYARKVDRYIALTPFARDKFIEGGLAEHKIAVNPNFLNEDIAPCFERGGGALFVGRLSEEKGLRTLLAAWEHGQVPIPLQIAGDGPMANEVAAAAQRLPGVTWLGRRDDVIELMRGAAFLVIPSLWYEGLPMVVVEAMAAGLPIVASRLGGLATMVQSQRTGLHFEAGNWRDLAQQVCYIAAHREQLIAMSRESRRMYEANYTAERHYQRLMAIYEQARSERGKDHSSSSAQGAFRSGRPGR